MPDSYRVDRFTVPSSIRDEFWRHVRRTHAILREQPGFVEDHLLEDTAADPAPVVTVVRWSPSADMAAVKAKVFAAHADADFDPPAFFAEHGIEAQLGNFEEAAS